MRETIASAAASPAGSSGQIESIQYGRALAALGVFLFHMDILITQRIGRTAASGTMFGGSTGVEFFFVISGFIILHVHRRDLDHPQAIFDFLAKRCVRLFPIYWLVVIPLGLLMFRFRGFGIAVDIDLSKFLRDVFLIPREGARILQPSWTLQHELVFYILFSTLILNVRIGIVVMIVWQGACAIVALNELIPVGYQNMQPLSRFVGHENFGFALGMLTALAHARFFGRYPGWFRAIGSIGAIGLVACLVLQGYRGGVVLPNAAAETLLFLVLYAMVICGLLSARPRGAGSLARALGVVGASSYVLYLIHEPLSSAVLTVLGASPLRGSVGAPTAAAIVVVVVVAASIAVHVCVEAPLLERCRAAVLRGRHRPAQAPSRPDPAAAR